MSERQKISFALFASALLHLLLGLFLAVWTRMHPMAFSKPLPDLKQLEVTLMPAPTPVPIAFVSQPTPPPKVVRSTLDSDGLQSTEKASDKALFESDINSRAASELPATGNAPLPSQQGKERPFDDFKTQNYSLGKGGQSTMSIAKNAPASTPEPTPTGVTEVKRPTVQNKLMPIPEELQVEPESTPQPTPFFTPTPAPTATPVPTVEKDTIALGKPTPVPTAAPQSSVAAASPTPVQQLAKLVPPPVLRAHTEAPQEQPQAEPGYQPQREQNKIDGGITNKGKAGVDAIATPLGRYRKSVADAIGSRWYFYVNNRMDLVTIGDVYVKFSVDAEGRVHDAKIVSNTANDTFGGYCVRAVTEAKIPPLPPEVAPALVNGRLEITYHFNIYPQ